MTYLTALWAHQVDLLEKLERTPRPAQTLLLAEPGVGVTHVLAHLAARRAAAGESVVVLVESAASLMQWQSRLAQRDHDSVSVDLFPSSSALLLALDGDSGFPARSSVSVFPVDLLAQGLGRRTVSWLTPSLLIIDQVPARSDQGQAQLLQLLASQARETIVALSPQDSPDWLPSPEVIEVEVDLKRSIPKVEIVRYSVSEREIRAFTRAFDLLGAESWLLGNTATTRAALHGSLLRLADELATQWDDPRTHQAQLRLNFPDELDRRGRPTLMRTLSDNTLDEVWSVIDELEQLGEDGRLQTVHQLALEAQRAQRPCLVWTLRADEGGYVATYLRDKGLDTRLLTGALSQSERGELLRDYETGAVLVATNVVDEVIERPADRSVLILWSPPQSSKRLRRLLTRFVSSGITFVAIVSSPPLAPDRQFESLLADLLG